MYVMELYGFPIDIIDLHSSCTFSAYDTVGPASLQLRDTLFHLVVALL